MPSPAYNSLLNLVSSYVDSKKAAEVIGGNSPPVASQLTRRQFGY